MYHKNEIEERLWSRTKVTSTGCIEWQGARHERGYGKINIGGTMYLTHRIAYELAFHAPDKLHVCHRCDNPPCCNPVHLFLGTQADNNKDSMLKGRRGKKLTPLQVDEIRKRYTPYCKINGGQAMGKEFNVTQSAISHIAYNDIWSWR